MAASTSSIPTTSFSYAQAAKREVSTTSSSPSLNPTDGNNPQNSKENYNEGKRDNNLPLVPSGMSSGPAQLERSTSSLVGQGGSQNHNETVTKVTLPSAHDAIHDQAKEEVAEQKSAEATMRSPRSAAKDDDVFAVPTPDGSTGFSWEKVSQASNPDAGGSKHTEPDDPDSKLPSLVQGPMSVSLKEAPVPAQNIWDMRRQKVEAEAREKQAQMKSARNVSGSGPNFANHGVSGQSETIPSDARASSSQEAKLNDGGSRSLLKGQERRNAPVDNGANTSRTARSAQGARTSSAVAPPPPADDSLAWPTPDLAGEEEKRRNADRADRGEEDRTPGGKAPGKEKWRRVEFTPTVVFNTPFPPKSRGSRASRGRDTAGKAARASSDGLDKKASGSEERASMADEENSHDRGRGNMGPPPKPVFTNSKTRRSSSAGAVSSKGATGLETTKSTKDETSTQFSSAGSAHVGPSTSRRTSIATQTDANTSTMSSRRQSRTGYDRDQSSGYRRQSQDGRHDNDPRMSEYFREGNSYQYERRDGRGDRGRGGYRGRGGQHALQNGPSLGSQPFVHSSSGSSLSGGFGPPRAYTLTDQRHGSLPQNMNYSQSHREQRGSYRGNPRSQTLPYQPTNGPLSHLGRGGPVQPLPFIQTDVANAYGGQPHPYGLVQSAMAFNPIIESMQMNGMIQMQLEYYFSLDNLCKDMFLRKHMDSQGFVPLSFVASFNRLKKLTTDLNTIRWICQQSSKVQLYVDQEGKALVRKADGWEQWVLSPEEREQDARHDGPTNLHMPQPYYEAPPNDAAPFYNGNVARPRRISEQHIVFQPADYGHPNGTEQANGRPPNGTFADAPITQTPLSATVPDFTPSLPVMQHDHFGSLNGISYPPDTFTDEQIQNLHIILGSAEQPQSGDNQDAPMAAATSSSHNGNAKSTPSEGLSNGNAPASAVPNGGVRTPETRDLDSFMGSKSPLPSKPGTRRTSQQKPQCYCWIFKASDHDEYKEFVTSPYLEFRQHALQQREETAYGQSPGDMKILYQFWAHISLHDFKQQMYEEFRLLALDDAENRGSYVGVESLANFYCESSMKHASLADRLAHDFVALVRSEAGKSRAPGYQKLRFVWRNGAFPFKNRLKIDKMIDADIRRDLDS